MEGTELILEIERAATETMHLSPSDGLPIQLAIVLEAQRQFAETQEAVRATVRVLNPRLKGGCF